jgi:hypothetical protein
VDPKSFTDALQKKYNFKLKGTSPIDFHLGQSFSWNDDGEMEISAKCYVDKMIDTYVQLYGEKPRKALCPLEQNDHPEMDDSPFLGQDETQQFQSLIGAMQWAVSIGRLDIATGRGKKQLDWFSTLNWPRQPVITTKQQSLWKTGLEAAFTSSGQTLKQPLGKWTGLPTQVWRSFYDPKTKWVVKSTPGLTLHFTEYTVYHPT